MSDNVFSYFCFNINQRIRRGILITGLILLAIAATSGSAYMDNDGVAGDSFLLGASSMLLGT